MAAGCTRELLAGKSHSWVKISHRNNEQATSDQYHCKKTVGGCQVSKVITHTCAHNQETGVCACTCK